jgi:glycosyltransferase involved in cell wall biosynthesis
VAAVGDAPELSIVIPSYKDPLIHRTIESLLSGATGSIEIIAVLDGYRPRLAFTTDPRLTVVRLPVNKGMREAINAGVAVARGRCLMRSDEHCVYAPGYDVVLARDLVDEVIMVPRRFKLDPVRWAVLPARAVDYEKLVISQTWQKFTGEHWITRDVSRRAIPVDETMAFQGSCWAMTRAHWDRVIGRLQTDGYGTHYQDSVEMSMKTWQAGGRLLVNKRTWFAHKHRDFKRTHNYPMEAARASFAYSLGLWRDYYEAVIRPRFGV